MRWLESWLVLLAAPVLMGAAAPQDPGSKPPPQPATESAPQTVALGEIAQRLTVPVVIGEAGPFRFVVDTGAERSVVSRELAARLNLERGPTVTLTSMTERSEVATVIVPSLTIPAIGEHHLIEAPEMDASNLGASGLLGLDTLRNHRLTIDFDKHDMEVRAARTREERHDPDEIVVRAKSAFGQLIVTDAEYGNIRVRVVIDTGSEVSMGNLALRNRIARLNHMGSVTLTSVTGGVATADYTYVTGFRFGKISFGNLPIAFADVAPFARFGLSNKPALLLGMDALRSFRRVDIDFANREMRLLPPTDVVEARLVRRPAGL